MEAVTAMIFRLQIEMGVYLVWLIAFQAFIVLLQVINSHLHSDIIKPQKLLCNCEMLFQSWLAHKLQNIMRVCWQILIGNNTLKIGMHGILC